jgi:hypothetical protein
MLPTQRWRRTPPPGRWGPPVRVICRLIAVAAWFAGAALDDGAYAQTKLSAGYTISLLGITVGKGTWELDINNNQYLENATGRISGVASKLISGEGSASTHGTLVGNHAQPAAFDADVKTDAEIDNIKMVFDATGITDLVVEPPLPIAPKIDRVPITEADRKGVLDPLSSLLIIADSDDVLKPQACVSRIPVFDGRRRYDIALSFKRMDNVKADTGYQGPVVICSIHVTPIAGHRVGGSIAQLLIKSDAMEVALAPLPGTRILAPFQAAIATAVGTLWIVADRFVATAPSPPK